MRKRTLLVALLLIGAMMAVFCSGAKEATPATGKTANVSGAFQVPAGGYDGSDVTITFYHTMGANLTKVLDEYIPEFN